MSSFPVPLVTGTIVFAILGVMFSCLGLYLRRTKTFSRDESQIWCASVILGVICCWIMWACTWLHQWHPLISPVAHTHGEAATPGAAH